MPAIAHVVIALVSASGIEVDNRQLIIQAVELARDRNVDFADAYLALQAAERSEKVCPSTRAISGVYRSNGRCPDERPLRSF